MKSFRFTMTVSALLFALCLAPLAAQPFDAKEPGDGRPPEAPAPQLAFRGWGLTADYQLVKVFGDTAKYTLWPYADLSGLPWNTAVTFWHDGGLAADPWDWRYLYVSVPIDWTLTNLYRFDLTTNTLSYVSPFPAGSTPTGWNYALQGLGARCASKLAKIYGGVGFYTHRKTHPVHVHYVREITTTGVESAVLGPVDESRGGDNAQDFFNGPHWFTYEGYDGSGNTSWGVIQLGTTPVVMGTLNDGVRPTGLLAYGSGRYYVSTQGARMYIVNTASGAWNPLAYIAWGVPAYPEARELIDLSNPANSCTPILP